MNVKKTSPKLVLASLIGTAFLIGQTQATIYHVKNGGNDANNGTSDANAWASTAKVSNFNLQPGDIVSFKRESIWSGTLNPGKSGTSSSRIVFNSYGSGVLPRLNPNNVTAGVGAQFIDLSGITIRNLRFASARSGLKFTANANEVKWLLIEDCEFANCSYAAISEYPGQGLTISGSKKYTDVRVLQNRVETCSRGIVIEEASGMPGFFSLAVEGNTAQGGKSGCFFLGRANSGATQNNSCSSTTGGSGVWFGVAGGRIQNSPDYFIKNSTFTNIVRNGAPDGVGFDFEGNCNGTRINTVTSTDTDGPGLIVLATGGPNTNLVITDYNITRPAKNPKNSDVDYAFWVNNAQSSGTINGGIWKKGSATAFRSPDALNSNWSYIGTSFQN